MNKVQTFKSFGRQTTIHGLNKMLRTSLKATRTVWLMCFLASCTFGARQLYGTVSTYLLYQTKTKVVTLPFEQIMFPAITICPGSIYRKSVVGNTDYLYTGAYLTINGGYENLAKASRASDLMCKSLSAPSNLTVNWINVSYTSQLVYDSDKSVMGCIFNGKPLNCKRLFINKQAELGWCFTFNTGVETLRKFAILGEPTRLLPAVYGTSVREKRDFPVRSGRRNSLTFILNVNASEICIPYVFIPGFVIHVHDPNTEPFLSTKPLIMLSPGFSTTIGISFKKIQKNTERLGLCLSQIRLKWYPNMTDYTFRDAYIIDCLMTLVFDRCKCLPFFASPQTAGVEIVRTEKVVCGTTKVCDSSFLSVSSF